MENHPQERRFNHILHENGVMIVNATKYTPKTRPRLPNTSP